jgi:hypothetical protein
LNSRPNHAERAGLKSANQTYQPDLRENSRTARATGKICSFEWREAMINQTRNDAETWKYAQKAMSWYGWGSPVGLGLLIVAIGASVVLLHVAGVIR